MAVSQSTAGTTLPAVQVAAAVAGGIATSQQKDVPPDKEKKSQEPVAVAVSPTLPPVPAYLVKDILAGKFIDLNLLGPCNLTKLLQSEPSETAFGRLLRNDLAAICTFNDWAEAWIAYVFVVASSQPEKISQFLSYFFIIASAYREVPGLGWRDYDLAFCKSAAEKPPTNWGEASPTLWVTSVLSKKGSTSVPDKSSPSSSGSTYTCIKWNQEDCRYLYCRFAHCCSSCNGSHPKVSCTLSSTSQAQAAASSTSSSSRAQSSEPSPGPVNKRKRR